MSANFAAAIMESSTVSVEQRRQRMVETLRRDSVVDRQWTDTPEDSSFLTPEIDPVSTFRMRTMSARQKLSDTVYDASKTL